MTRTIETKAIKSGFNALMNNSGIGIDAYSKVSGCPRKRTVISHMKEPLQSVLLILSVFFSCAVNVQAINAISIDIQQIQSKDWQLKNVSFNLTDLDNNAQKITLSAKQLSLPEPYDKLTFFNVDCSFFRIKKNNIVCKKGKAKLSSKDKKFSPLDFSFAFTEDQRQFSVNNFTILQGSVALTAKQQGDSWDITIQPKAIKLQNLLSLLGQQDLAVDKISQGNISADIKLKGNKTTWVIKASS